jgi:hypothetical protein
MRPTFGVCWACLALTSLAACSSASPPPPEGNAIINSSSGCGISSEFISGPKGAPTSDSIGGTVLDGTGNGVHVSCKVSSHGAINAKIESADMSMQVFSDNVSSGATMSFYVTASGNPSLESIDTTTNRSAPTCTVTPYALKAGSIYARFDCPTVRVTGSTSLQCDVNGFFVFTGCDT